MSVFIAGIYDGWMAVGGAKLMRHHSVTLEKKRSLFFINVQPTPWASKLIN